jgi:hypothetical protein
MAHLHERPFQIGIEQQGSERCENSALDQPAFRQGPTGSTAPTILGCAFVRLSGKVG